MTAQPGNFRTENQVLLHSGSLVFEPEMIPFLELFWTYSSSRNFSGLQPCFVQLSAGFFPLSGYSGLLFVKAGSPYMILAHKAMNRTIFYIRVILPNLVFLSIYLLFLANRELFSNGTNTFSWAGYSFSVLVLVSISVYLNRAHSIRIRFDEKEACLDKLRRKFYENGYVLKGGHSNRLYFNKTLVQSSFFTPEVTVYIRKDHLLLHGPKVKIDNITEWFDEQDCTEVIPFEPELEPQRLAG